MTVDPRSTSYPVLGAADACGVDYGLALRLIDACDREPALASGLFWLGAYIHGFMAMSKLLDMLADARAEGRLQ